MPEKALFILLYSHSLQSMVWWPETLLQRSLETQIHDLHSGPTKAETGDEDQESDQAPQEILVHSDA